MNPSQSISPERVLTILDSYGGDPSRWPTPERAAALDLIEHDTTLQQAQQQALSLDRMLGQSATDIGNDDIQRLQHRLLDKLSSPAAPSSVHRQWYGALAAGMAAVVFGFIVLTGPETEPGTPDRYQDFHAWAWQDITGELPVQQLTDNVELFPLIALAEPELLDE